MNRAQIRALSRGLTLIETDDWSEADLNTVIDQATYVVGSRFDWPFLAETTTFSSVATQQAYAFNIISDSAGTGKYIARISAVMRSGKQRLSEVGMLEATSRYGDDWPDSVDATEFFVFGANLYLIPVPTTSQSGGYRIYYYRRPTLMTNDSAEPEWDPQFHECIVSYVVSKIWEREEDMEKAKYWSEKFDQSVESMARFYLNRVEDRPAILGGRPNRAFSTNLPLS